MNRYERAANPQILVDVQDQTRLLVELARDGHNGAAIQGMARAALVDAIHTGIGLAAVMAVWGIWQTRKVPVVQIRPRVPSDRAAVSDDSDGSDRSNGSDRSEGFDTVGRGPHGVVDEAASSRAS